MDFGIEAAFDVGLFDFEMTDDDIEMMMRMKVTMNTKMMMMMMVLAWMRFV